jgi:hypothetical protein
MTVVELKALFAECSGLRNNGWRDWLLNANTLGGQIRSEKSFG